MAPAKGTPSTSRKMESYVKVTKTITLGVAFKPKSKKTIEMVKERLSDMEDIETNLQKVFFTEKNFGNDQVLDYETKDGSNVHMNLHLGDRMEVHVEVSWSNTTELISLDVHSWDTIGDMKIKFQEKEGTPANQLTLVYNETQLDDDLQTLAGYAIKNDSIIHAVFLGEDKIKISVCPPDKCPPIQVMVKFCSSVENLKRIIHYMEKFAVIRQELTFNGIVLQNDRRLTDYNIQMGSELQLDFTRRTNGMQIFVKHLTGIPHTIYYVDSSTTVHDLKTEIRYVKGTPERNQRLIFNGKQLLNDHTLGDCNIVQGSTIHFALKLCGC